MVSISGMITSLTALKSDLSLVSARMQRECDYINETISKIQANFGDQAEGQAMAIAMYKALQEITMADSALYRVSQGIDTTVSELRK